MTFDEYKEIIKNGERVDWYGTQVPFDLLTPRVHAMASAIMESLSIFETEIEETKKGSKERSVKQNYYDKVYNNVQRLPYTMNGLINDVYMVKYKRIVEEIESEKNKEEKPKVRRTRKKTTTKTKNTPEVKEEEKTEEPKVVSRRGKNNKLIFGK